MSEVHLKKGEPVDKALRRLKKKLDREQTLIQVRLHRRFEKPSAKRRRKEKAARFTAMLKARYEFRGPKEIPSPKQVGLLCDA
jgi:small subunit ribosomal protein S21